MVGGRILRLDSELRKRLKLLRLTPMLRMYSISLADSDGTVTPRAGGAFFGCCVVFRCLGIEHSYCIGTNISDVWRAPVAPIVPRKFASSS